MSDFSEFHDELRSVARTALADASPVQHHGDPGPAVGADVLAGTGWLGLEVPESAGGAGATFAETAIVLTELGRAAATSGFVGTAVLGVGALACAEPGERRDALLAAAAVGEARLTVAVDLATASPAPGFALTADGAKRVLSGSAGYVIDAAGADVVLVVAATDGAPALVVVDAADLTIDEVPVVDATCRLARVTADSVTVADDAVLAFAVDPDDAIAHLGDRIAVAVACDALGVAEQMLDATVEYAGQREQFARPIGSFQAVKHQCADMLVAVAITRELVDAAVLAVAAGPGGPGASVAASMAKSYAADAAVDVAGTAMQLHGGIGYTWESGIHVYLKRATMARSLAGTSAEHRRRISSRYAASTGGGA